MDFTNTIKRIGAAKTPVAGAPATPAPTMPIKPKTLPGMGDLNPRGPGGGFGMAGNGMGIITDGGGPSKPPVAPVAPPPMVPGGVPPVTGAALSTINPQQDLRHQTITPDNAGAPNLTELAQQQFDDLGTRAMEQQRTRSREIGQSAAKFGRIGAGMTTTSLSDLNRSIEGDLAMARRGLASDVASGDLSERRAQRGELRGERDYQYGLDRDAQGDAERRVMMEEALLSGDFNRAMGRANLGYQAGADRQASGGDALQSLAEYLFQRQAGKKPGQSSPEPVDTSNILYSPY